MAVVDSGAYGFVLRRRCEERFLNDGPGDEVIHLLDVISGQAVSFRRNRSGMCARSVFLDLSGRRPHAHASLAELCCAHSTDVHLCLGLAGN